MLVKHSVVGHKRKSKLAWVGGDGPYCFFFFIYLFFMLSFARMEEYRQKHLLQEKSFHYFDDRKKIAESFY